MEKTAITSFIHLLHKVHKEEWVQTPSRKETICWLNELFSFLFPNDHLKKESTYIGKLSKGIADLQSILLSYLNPATIDIEKTVSLFYEGLEDVYNSLRSDAQKTFENDPAATSVHEVIASYPGFFAIAVYRLAHNLSKLGVPILPRILTEYAHGKTGVDIHPQAEIGVPFFIDHGTGIVIGATSIIGKNVSIYQGVTLGALHVNKDMSEVKRHPTVEDNVVIYARTTILGGGTVIGHDSIIGGSVFLTKSVEPFSSVFNTHQLRIETKRKTYEVIELGLENIS